MAPFLRGTKIVCGTGCKDPGAKGSKMDGYVLESSPFFFNQATYVSLYRGRTKTTQLPVVVKRHDFMLIQQSKRK